ncbi:Restriction of telomere capping protein 5 [Mortierella sp. GBA30]|nr:Restriction of telomere capping protein 5 [Mortierella sp. GBA30]
MGTVHSLLNGASDSQPTNTTGASGQQHYVDRAGQSRSSVKMYKDVAGKFTELEMLSLRQVFQQLKSKQDASIPHKEPSQQHMESSQQSHRPVGITEDTFIEYLNLGHDKHRIGRHFFRSFCHLAVYPDNTNPLTARNHPHSLTARDLLKPLALYCQKIGDDALLGIKPLKAIFESFAENATQSGASVKPAATEDEQGLNTDGSLPQEGPGSLKTSKTIEDSLKDLTLQANFEWNPEDDDLIDSGPHVKALDLVDILDGLFWLAQEVVDTGKQRSGPDANEDSATDRLINGSHQHTATRIVEHIIQYSRNESLEQVPVDLCTETIDYTTFSKFVSRNAPNIFAVLSQHFYSLFLIGKTLRPPETSGERNIIVLPDMSPIPVLSASSIMLTPENLALVSWFLPQAKTTPTMTNLYTGSVHGFSMNQFEVHVCKYPAPTLLLLLVERQKSATADVYRRQSISFGTSRQRHSISSTSPTYNTPWGIDQRRSSIDRLKVSGPNSTSALNTIVDEATTISTTTLSTRSSDTQLFPPSSQGSITSETGAAVAVVPRKSKDRMVLGAYVTETWKVSKSGWGNDSFALFELSPCFEVFPAKKKETSGSPTAPAVSTSMTSSSKHSTVPGNRHYIHFLKNAGVGFGGQESENCMLYMDDNLRYGNYRQDFAGGNVYMSAGGPRRSGFQIDFEIVECEVWGLGGPEAKAKQVKEWEFEQREANRRASVHMRSKDGEQDIDRDLLHNSKRQEQGPGTSEIDPCNALGQVVEPDITWTLVHQCYNHIPYNATEANIILSTLHTLYKDYYIFLDSAMLENQPKPFTNPPVDMLGGLDQISKREYSGDFRFQTDVDTLVNSLNDAHANYMAHCYRHYLFQQPFDLYAPVVNNVQTVRILVDRSSNGLEECQVLTIDGVKALDAIQHWADTHLGFSKDAGVRLNKALTGSTFNTAQKIWAYAPGQFTSRVTLPERQTMIYQVQCPLLPLTTDEDKNKDNDNQKRIQYVKADWEVFRLMSWNEFDSTESFLTQNCYSDTDPANHENYPPGKKKRDFVSSSTTSQDQNNNKLRRRHNRNNNINIQAAIEIPRHETIIKVNPLYHKRQEPNTIPVARLVYSGSTTLFYQLLRRPSIGVVVIPTHTVNMKTEHQALEQGFSQLYQVGVRNVILDLTGNGGGYVNFAYDLVDWMFPNENQTSVYKSDLRASMSVKALAQEDLAQEEYSSYFNPGSYSDPLTGEEHQDNFFMNDRVIRHAQHRLGYSPLVYMNHHGLGAFEMDMPWQHDAERIVVMTDGSCGSACGMTLNRLKNRHGVKSYAVGGRVGEDLSLFSFPGASVYGMDDIIDDFENLGVDTPMRRLRYKGIYRVPVMEFFQEVEGSQNENGTMMVDPRPIEYSPELYKADYHLDYTPITARNHEMLWEIIANNHWKEDGQTGDDPSIEKKE